MLELGKKIIAVTLAIVIFAIAAFAKNEHPNKKTLTAQVFLNEIKAIKSEEEKGDEIYFTVTSFFNKNRHQDQHVRFPEAPLSWPSNSLNQIKHLKVWQHDLEEGEAVTIAFTLIEQDIQPWNTDDLIGVIRLHIKNENGKLISKWSDLEKNETVKAQKNQATMRAHGAGEYELKLELEKQKAKK